MNAKLPLALLVSMLILAGAPSAVQPGDDDLVFAKWLKPHDWKRDRDQPGLSLGDKGKFDDQHIFAPHVIRMGDEFWMYYCGSQRCVDAGTYKGKAKDPANPAKSDQRLFKLGLAKSKDGIHFKRHSAEPVFSFGDDIHSVVTATILSNADGSVHRDGKGRLRMKRRKITVPPARETTSYRGCAASIASPRSPFSQRGQLCSS